MTTGNDGSRLKRRTALKGIGAGMGAIGLAGCSGGGGGTPTPRVVRETVVQEQTVVQERTVVKEGTPQDLDEEHVLEGEGGISTLVWFYGSNNGAWRQHGIDLSAEYAAYGKYVRQVTAGLSNLSGGISIPPVIQQINEGEDLTMYGVKLNINSLMLAKPETAETMDGPADLADKTLGVPFDTSTSTNVYRGIFLDEFDFDILEDTANTRASPPPVLWNLLIDDELDVVIEFSAQSLEAQTRDDMVTVFDPVEYWRDTYGLPPPVATWTSYRGWLQDNADLALRFLAGWEDALQMTKDNVNEAIRNYGRIAGITSEAVGDVVVDWMDQDRVFGPLDFDQEQVDNVWTILQLMDTAGAFESLPPKDQILTSHGQLSDWA